MQFTLQTDIRRRQLEVEACQIRSAMEEQLGSCQEMERRAQVGEASPAAMALLTHGLQQKNISLTSDIYTASSYS